MAEEKKQKPPKIRNQDKAASGAPTAGWASGDRFSWQEIQHRLLASASEEIRSTFRELFFSGFTAGIAIILTLIGFAVGTAHFPDNIFLSSLLYPLGFIYIILGRYQLYTENTLPPVALILSRLASVPRLLRVWGIVLLANLLGATFGAYIIANTNVLSPKALEAATIFVSHGMELNWWDVFFRALFAGWLVAGVVWLTIAARDTISRILIIYLVFFMIGACGLFHVITAAAEVAFVIFHGNIEPSSLSLILDYWLPVLLGNTVGGVFLFTNMAYGQAEYQRYPEIRILNLQEMLFTMKGGRPFGTPRPTPPPEDEQ